jgi:hypothetical protein
MVAKKQTKKKPGAKVSDSPQVSVTNQVAEYIGMSLADLMNRKDALARQLATVDQQISAARRRVAATVSQGLPALSKLVGGKTVSKKAKSAKTGNRKRKRPLPPDEPMVAATERTRAAEAKGRAAQRARTSLRSGNR